MRGQRRLLVLTFLGGSLGTVAELLLMAHTDGPWQKAPVGLLAAGCLALLVHVSAPREAMRRAFLGLMVVFATIGVAGGVLHSNGNLEFATELDPGMSGGALLREVMTGATPVLAPGTMVLLAAVGWACVRK